MKFAHYPSSPIERGEGYNALTFYESTGYLRLKNVYHPRKQAHIMIKKDQISPHFLQFGKVEFPSKTNISQEMASFS